MRPNRATDQRAAVLVRSQVSLEHREISANFDASISANTWYALQFIVNGASSVISRNGTEATGDAGANTIAARTLMIGDVHAGDPMSGSIMEVGVLTTGAIDSTPRTALNTNMRGGYGGF